MSLRRLAEVVAAAEVLGRSVLPGERVFALNGDMTDLRPENLVVVQQRKTTVSRCLRCDVLVPKKLSKGICWKCRRAQRRSLVGLIECPNCGNLRRARLDGFGNPREGWATFNPELPLCQLCKIKQTCHSRRLPSRPEGPTRSASERVLEPAGQTTTPRGTLGDCLRQAAEDSGLSVSTASRESGVPQSRLHEFMAGGGLSLKNADKLAAYFGLELRPQRRGMSLKQAAERRDRLRVGEALRELLADCGLSMNEISSRSRVSVCSLFLFWKKRRGLSADSVGKLLSFFGVNLPPGGVPPAGLVDAHTLPRK